MTTPKWKTRAYTITGWIGFGCFILVLAIDGALALLDKPTFSQYVRARHQDQPVFGYIVLGLLIYLILHWFWRFWKKKK